MVYFKKHTISLEKKYKNISGGKPPLQQPPNDPTSNRAGLFLALY
jgi:hypothetical protein